MSISDMMDTAKQFFNTFGNVVADIWDDFVNALITAFTSIYEFHSMLVDQNIVMQDMIDQISAGNTFDGVSLVTFIGAYRYLAGEALFMYTYLIIIAGAGFMVYKLILAIINFIKNVFFGSGDIVGKIAGGKLFK